MDRFPVDRIGEGLVVEFFLEGFEGVTGAEVGFDPLEWIVAVGGGGYKGLAFDEVERVVEVLTGLMLEGLAR